MVYNNKSERLYMNYDGPFNIEVISTLAKFLRENTLASEHTRRRIYKVFIELVQNVALYSTDRVKLKNGSTIGRGTVQIFEYQDNFQCITINKILKEHAIILQNNCNDINNSTIEELKLKKKKLLNMINVRDTGAHIGLIMIKSYSGNLMEYEFLDDKNTGDTYFKITATINLEKEREVLS